MSNAQRVTVGADPELFVATSDGKMLSCIGMIPGTKEAPCPVDMGAVQVDNVLAEYNIDPATDEDSFVRSLVCVRASLEAMLPVGVVTVVQASHDYGQEIDTFPPEAHVFGCDPDFDAWNHGVENLRPEGAPRGLRSAGGHVHIGWANPTDAERLRVVQMCDYTMGLWSVIFDADKRRRQLYGKAGAYRPKSYGVEYRTLSNFWISSPDYMRKVYRFALMATDTSKLEVLTGMIHPAVLRNIINTGDAARAMRAFDMVMGVLNG